MPQRPGVCHGAPGPPFLGPGVSAQHSHWSACPAPLPGTIAGALALAEPPTLDRETAPKGCHVPLPGTSGCVLLLGVGLLRLPRQIPKTPRVGRLKRAAHLLTVPEAPSPRPRCREGGPSPEASLLGLQTAAFWPVSVPAPPRWPHFNFVASLMALSPNTVTLRGTGGQGFNMGRVAKGTL